MVICITKYLLSEKNELSKIWLAAHWEKKLKRTQVFEVNIERSVHDILETEIILDLRISGHLLVGIVKIHSRKTKYLLNECNDIFYQVKIFRTGLIDLPDNKKTAAVNDITLKEFFENFYDIENNLPDSMLTSNQTLIEEITLKETSEKLTLFDDDDMQNFVYHEEDEPITFDGFPLNLDEESLHIKNLGISANLNVEAVENKKMDNDKQTNPSITRKKVDELIPETFDLENFVDEIPESIEIPDLQNVTKVLSLPDNLDSSSIDFNHESSDKLSLEPVKIPSSHISKNPKKKKRKLRVDYIKAMSYEVIKKQVLDTSDIISVLDLTPATRRLMTLKETGSAEHLLQFPALRFLNPNLLKLYQHNLKTCKCDDNLELSSNERESFGNFNVPVKKSTSELSKNYVMDKNMQENFDLSSVSRGKDNGKNKGENDILDLDDNFMFDTELENITLDQTDEREIDQLVPQKNVLSNYKVQISDADYIQHTEASNTSEGGLDYALQGKIIQMLQCLKLLFQENSIICFSSLTRNKNKLRVAQQFLCLLMLKKFHIISLEQAESFGEVFISPEMNFDVAYAKFCI